MNTSHFHRIQAVALAVVVIGLVGCRTMSVDDVMSGGANIFQAASITDAQMAQEAKAAAADLDKKNRLAPKNSKYQKRINKVANNLKSARNVPLNIRVYMTQDINAFALANGTIRIYSGLMDVMNDDEVLFIVGHEMGHVAKKGHTKKRMRTALLTKAGRQMVTSTANTEVAALTASQLGDFTEKVINAQFSQADEHEADDYGLMILKQKGKNPESSGKSA